MQPVCGHLLVPFYSFIIKEKRIYISTTLLSVTPSKTAQGFTVCTAVLVYSDTPAHLVQVDFLSRASMSHNA